MNTVKSDQKKKRKLFTFEPDPDVDEMLEKARTAGIGVGDILNQSIRDCGGRVIMELARQRAEALKRLSFNYTRDLALGVA